MIKTLKVGFDMDGVILYNPLRVFRGLAKKLLKPIKSSLLHKDKSLFYFPKSSFEKYLWTLIHKSSFKVNRGFLDLKEISKNKKIKLYLITGRYGFLENDYNRWLKKIKAKRIFTQCYINKKNLQPNQFKENMIKKLKLDIYVEDNLDIIEKLNHHTKASILWITNAVDKNIPYHFKYYSLKEVCQYLSTLV